MEMPTPCNNCGELFDLHDGKVSPRYPPVGADRIIICESCADKEQEEVDREEEIAELKEQIADYEYTLNAARERLAEIGGKKYSSDKHLTPCVAGPFGHSLMLKDGTKVCVNRGKGAEAAHVWLTNESAEIVTVQDKQ